MSFNLRGGRPKNMNQGVYWVQRHIRDTRPATIYSSSSIDPTIQQADTEARAFNKRYKRITQTAKRFFREPYDLESLFESDKPNLKKLTRKAVAVRKQVNRDISFASMHDLDNLSIALRNLMQEVAVEQGLESVWVNEVCTLKVGRRKFSFK